MTKLLMTTENLESECHGIGGGAFRVALDFMPIAQSGNFIGVKPDGGTAGQFCSVRKLSLPVDATRI